MGGSGQSISTSTLLVCHSKVASTAAKQNHTLKMKQERKERVTRVRACNYIKIETGQNFPASTKNSNTHWAGCVKC